MCQEPSSARFNSSRSSRGHLDSSPGGSLTTSLPPSDRRGAPHSRVAAGDPKPRAVTRVATPRKGPLATSTTSPHTTSTRSERPSSPTAQRRKVQRLAARSTSAQLPLVAPASTRPGRPPPDPISIPTSPSSSLIGCWSTPRRRKPVLCSTPLTAALGVTNPSADAASRTSWTFPVKASIGLVDQDHHSTRSVATLRSRGNTVDFTYNVVNELAVSCCHRL